MSNLRVRNMKDNKGHPMTNSVLHQRISEFGGKRRWIGHMLRRDFYHIQKQTIDWNPQWEIPIKPGNLPC